MAKQLGCSVSEELQKEIDEMRGMVSRSKWVSMLLELGIEAYKNKNEN